MVLIKFYYYCLWIVSQKRKKRRRQNDPRTETSNVKSWNTDWCGFCLVTKRRDKWLNKFFVSLTFPWIIGHLTWQNVSPVLCLNPLTAFQFWNVENLFNLKLSWIMIMILMFVFHFEFLTSLPGDEFVSWMISLNF